MDNTTLDQTLLNLKQTIKNLADVASRPVTQEITEFVEFRAQKGGSNTGKGILWTHDGKTKQIVLHDNGKFFISENIDLASEKSLMIGGAKVLDANTLGPSIEKSNLREVGRLKGLVVDGSISVNSYIYFDSKRNRLGLGIEKPNSTISVCENNVEMMLGTKDNNKGMIGTFATHGVDIVTDNTTRISISPDGNIQLGNKNYPPIQVSIHGSLGVNVGSPDNRARLDVNGPIKFNNVIHLSGPESPKSGVFNLGDIVWNNAPSIMSYIGWVCTNSGNPGSWEPFGKIGNQLLASK